MEGDWNLPTNILFVINVETDNGHHMKHMKHRL